MTHIQDWLEAHNISEVEALMPDLSGVARGKVMPASKYSKEGGMRLPEALVLQTITGSYPEDWRAVHPSDRDMWARGDPKTIRIVPWAREPTAQIIHDCFHADGTPVEATPRQVLRRVLQAYASRGWTPVVAPELEFFLVKPNLDPDNRLEAPIGRSGRAEIGRQPYGIDALNEFDPIIEDIYDYCEAQALELDAVIHEAGAAQLEFNLEHGDALELADQAFLIKRTVREAAMRRNMYATFMAKPMEDEPGSAMHLHQSIVDTEGANIFATADGSYSKLFLSHIAGLQAYLPSAMSLLAPNVNSYRRFTRDRGAPINVHWGYDNRTAGLRVPDATADSMRIENRVAGADANPYLAIAASLACGYLGMVQQLEPSAPIEGDAYDLPFALPRSLEQSLGLLLECQPLRELFGENFVLAFHSVKEQEFEAFLKVISSWEREFLLLNV